MKHFYSGLPVLVTGGAGFIGSHLTHKLVELGAQVTVIDNLTTGFLDNLAPVLPSITFVQASVTDLEACLQVTQGQQIIFHLAAQVSVPESVERPQLCHHVNVNGTFNMLEAARLNKVPRFIFSSSSAVYGAYDGICSEDTPCNPTSPYGTSKLIGEYLCRQYTANYEVKSACLRYFNVYGERQNHNGTYAAVIAKFQQCMCTNQPITIFGDGTQTRDFIPVEEVVKANLTIGMQKDSVLDGSPCNIATGRSMSLLELIEQLKADYPTYHHPITFQPARAGDIKHSGAQARRWKGFRQKGL
jgi:UDP-N-acetylglucosamine/UDP-N-acetylgalactosamine 4-epimerase